MITPTSWIFPPVVRDSARSILRAAGIRQGWQMFSPNPTRSNKYVEAEIRFRDGTRARWAFPRLHEMGALEHFWKSRHRKWSNGALTRKGNRRAWVAASRYLTQVHSRPGNPVREVELQLFERRTRPPKFRLDPVSTPAGGYRKKVLYVWRPNPPGAGRTVE